MKGVLLFVAVAGALLFCAAPALAYDESPIGWADYNALGCGTTTGGQGGDTVTATTEAELIEYATSETPGPLIIQVQGLIDLNERVDISPNKTLIGIGASPTITGYNLRIRGEDSGGVPLGYNVIVRNLIIAEHSGGDSDGLTIQDGAHHIWVDHCTFYDCADGCLDITHACEYITVSWCKFYYVNQSSHRNVNLIGNTDGSEDDIGTFHVTFHHNWWSTLCDQRMPSVRYGTVHMFNNYYNAPGNLYCIRTRLYAQCLVENNYFKDVQNPWERYVTSVGVDHPGLLYASGNILDNVTWDDTYEVPKIVLIDGNDTVSSPPYFYTLDDANYIPAIVQYGAGAGGKEGYPPHWYFTVYGDFDISGLVDINDLETFVDYWLDTNDVADINDADYNGDGIVDGYEYALFAGNYLYVPDDITPPAVPQDLSASASDGSVALDWTDNDEPDFDGYNVYRSTTIASGYTELNGSLLTDSNYIDNTVTNGTVYFYYVTAVDTASNESGGSTKVPAIPIDANTVVLQEEESGFCGVDGIIDTKHAGYTGSGFCDTENASGQGIDWSINIAAADTYTFIWRYAHGKTDDRTARLLVNGSPVVASITFPQTGDWTNWSTVSVDLSMTTGIKSIRLEATTGNGLANIDYMMVTGPDLQIADCL